MTHPKPTSSPGSDKPNIILCVCDQLQAAALACYGHPLVRTPNIDQLAARGALFRTAVSNHPVCMPARSALLTGQYARTCGVLGNYSTPDRHMPERPVHRRDQMLDPTLPEILAHHGYDNTLIGKWHIHPAPELLGFHHSLYPWVHHRHTRQTFIKDSREEFTVTDRYSIDVEADAVADFLRRPHDRPFFLYYNISPPHMPLYDAPPGIRNLYDPADIPLPPNTLIDNRLPHDPHWFMIYLHDFLYYQQKQYTLDDLPPAFNLKHLHALYLGLVSWVDETVGRLLHTLRDQHLDDNTVVVFTSDHGDMLGSHHHFNKSRLYEQAIRIPLIFAGPSLSPLINTAQVAQTIDIMPTLLRLAGLDIPTSVQGRDLTPLLHRRCDHLPENYAVIETDLQHLGLRTPTATLGFRLDDQFRRIIDPNYQFFNLTSDPFQQHNLAHDPACPPQKQHLHAVLDHWHHTTPFQPHGSIIYPT